MNKLNRTGVLLINLGTPHSPDKKNVRSYLSEFLNDPRVIDLPTPWRQLLVNLCILPFRPKVSAHAYKQIWMMQGSPLLINTQQLAEEISKILGEKFEVVVGMRYGSPSLSDALKTLQFKRCQKLIIFPLFPQYSSAATGSALEKTLSLIKTMVEIPEISVVSSFHDCPELIEAWSSVINDNMPQFSPEKWIFSYHGLPVRHLKKRGCDPVGCMEQTACHSVTEATQQCYRQQCFQTSQLIAEWLALSPQQYEITFQSRLGRTPWILPYTDQVLIKLSQQGIKRLAIVCPSFVTDCLETLEEVGIRAKQQWLNLGGTDFHLFPALNTHPSWIKGLSQLIINLS